VGQPGKLVIAIGSTITRSWKETDSSTCEYGKKFQYSGHHERLANCIWWLAQQISLNTNTFVDDQTASLKLSLTLKNLLNDNTNSNPTNS